MIERTARQAEFERQQKSEIFRNQKKKYKEQLDSLNVKDSVRLKPHGLSSHSPDKAVFAFCKEIHHYPLFIFDNFQNKILSGPKMVWRHNLISYKHYSAQQRGVETNVLTSIILGGKRQKYIDTYCETEGGWVRGTIVWTLTLKQSNTASDDKTPHFSLQTAMCKYCINHKRADFKYKVILTG